MSMSLLGGLPASFSVAAPARLLTTRAPLRLRPFSHSHSPARRQRQSDSERLEGLEYNGTTYPYVWLRDACPCPACLHPSTRQKLHRTSDVPPGTRPAPGPGGVHADADGVRVNWDSGHASTYSRAFLERYASAAAVRAFHRDDAFARVEWDAARLCQERGGEGEGEGKLFQTYEKLRTREGLLAAITQLARYGLLFVRGVPTGRTADAECELRALAARFGELRGTFYGETWDVKNVKNSRNIAYTNVDLGLHMDLLYFQHPPRYQILHCLRNRVQGGTSIFVDAAHVASRLRTEDPAAFDTLATTPVAFHYVNDGHHLHHAHPTIQLARSSSSSSSPVPPQVEFINYSPPFQAPLALDTPPAFYTALARFAGLLEEPAQRFEYLLAEGDAVLFDNRRVLHARTAFSALEKGKEGETEGEGEGETDRWLKGCYLEADAVLDRGRVLRAEFGV